MGMEVEVPLVLVSFIPSGAAGIGVAVAKAPTPVRIGTVPVICD